MKTYPVYRDSAGRPTYALVGNQILSMDIKICLELWRPGKNPNDFISGGTTLHTTKQFTALGEGAYLEQYSREGTTLCYYKKRVGSRLLERDCYSHVN